MTTPNRKKIWAICNPMAGQNTQDRITHMIELLKDQDLAPQVQFTAYPGHAEQLAREACQNNVALIIICGGDGTLNEIANGILAGQKQAGSLPALAVYPTGTANVVAKELGVPLDPVAFAALLRQNRQITVWPAEINDRYFIAMAGAGVDAQVVGQITPQEKKKLSVFTYILQTLTLLRQPWEHVYSVRIDGRIYRAASVIVTNSRYYAGKFELTPLSRLTEPRLYTCLITQGTRAHLLRVIFGLLAGRFHRQPFVRIIPGQSVTIEGLTTGPVQVDGDIRTKLPVTIRVGQKPLQFIAGQTQ
ncbi:Hypothetical protein LUCI_4702 [Lucifera butyrica]|uniref:DAGKc domain-containing protein n=1 Tax=Lucifera butyrica TaxID=1351585 RepID=A0A498RH50_9FIRM|nr:diacylglycerol kinase family protein [Lucifera butyrica]VBB09412.1 Hypothetical protein LUCI_4702 [Lucifera butyrica]